MLCDRCGKREATIQYIQVINGNKQELHLCSKCGKEVGVDDFAMPMSISNFFGDLFNDYSFPLLNNTGSLDIVCKECNTSFNDFLNTGKMGCANCYKTFSKKLNPILKRIQGGTEYLGENIGSENNANVENSKLKENDLNKDIEDKIKFLENKLKKCIQEENYEEAAKIRDEIKIEKTKIDKNKMTDDKSKKNESNINKMEKNKSNENIENTSDAKKNNNSNQDKGGNN
jgi:protein arginine kinase activator